MDITHTIDQPIRPADDAEVNLVLALEPGVDPAAADLIVSADPEDASWFAVSEASGKPLGYGRLAWVGSMSLSTVVRYIDNESH